MGFKKLTNKQAAGGAAAAHSAVRGLSLTNHPVSDFSHFVLT